MPARWGDSAHRRYWWGFLRWRQRDGASIKARRHARRTKTSWSSLSHAPQSWIVSCPDILATAFSIMASSFGPKFQHLILRRLHLQSWSFSSLQCPLLLAKDHPRRMLQKLQGLCATSCPMTLPSSILVPLQTNQNSAHGICPLSWP